MRILIIEDDPELHEFLRMSLSAHTTAIDSAIDGHKGSFLARTNPYDCIILDITLPKKNGLEVCKEIREAGVHSPILILSAIGSTHSKVNLLEAGADDYIAKPFSFDELLARIHAIARRPKSMISDIIVSGDISINIPRQTVIRGGKNIYLTKKEFSLLEYLMRNKGMVLSRGMIMEHVWNVESDPFSNTIEAHILNLRKKINAGSKKNAIRNIPGRGYMIEA